MRGRVSAGRRSAGRLLFHVAGWCALCFALLTCSPPDFTPPPAEPTGEPLVIAPLEPEVTAGMSFTFAASGGTPPYLYSATGGGTISSTGKYTAPAYPATVTVEVTDEADATASTIVMVRASQLWIVPADVTIPADTSITFQGQGGTPPYSYTKIIGGVGSIDLDSGVYSSTVGGTAQIKVTDSASPSAQTVTTDVVVTPPVVPLSISPASAILETNLDIQFNASGGSGGYSFAVVPGGKGSVTTGGLYSSGGLAGAATVRVTDSALHTADAAVTVNDPPPPLTITPTSATVVPLTTQDFTAAGGTPPYTFTLVGVGSIAPDGNPRTYSALDATGLATLTVADSRSRTASAPISVTPALGITPSSTSIEVNGTVMLVASGGTAPYASWAVSGGGTVPPSSSGPTVIYTAPATPVVATVTLTDSVPNQAVCIITVTPGPLAISPATITIQVGTSIVFAADGGNSYTFSKVSGVGSIDSGSGEYSSPVEGAAIVRVTDDYLRTQDAAVTVNPPPLALSPESITIQSGSSVTFTADGGTPPYAFSKVSGVGGIHGTTGVYTSAAEGSAVVGVTDSENRTDTAAVTVEPPPAPPLNLSPVVVNVQTSSDQTFAASGGTPPYGWGATAGTITSSGVYTAPSSVPGSPTSYDVQVADSSLPTPQVRIAKVNVYLPLEIEPHPTSVDAGALVDFNATGGISTFSFSVPTGHGTIVELTGAYTAPGVQAFETVRVTDSQGKFEEWSFAVVDPAKWLARTTVDPTKAGLYASMALDGSGAPQIAYFETQGKDLKIARWNAGWTVSTIDATANSEKRPSLVIDATGKARVAWYEASDASLRYSAWNGSSWDAPTIVAASGVGPYVSLALDGSGSPGIAYYDTSSGDLKYVAWNGTGWNAPQLADGATDDVGQYASLAFNGSDQPRIAYFDVTHGTLKYAAWNSSTWIIETADGAGTVGTFASLKVTSADIARVAYYDHVGKNLKFVYRDAGGIWRDARGNPGAGTIDVSGDVGQFASLALDPTDSHPTVAYYDLTNTNLKYAEWNTTALLWVIGTVDGAANNVGQYASLALDPSSGKMKIAYHDASATAVDLLFIQEQ